MQDLIQELKETLETQPQPRVFLQLADLFRQGNQIEEAVQTLDRCLTMFPRYLSAKIALAKIHHSGGNHTRVIELCQEVIQSDPENLVAMRLAASSYHASGDLVESIKNYKRLRAMNPGNPEVEDKILLLEEMLRPKLSPRERKVQALKTYLSKYQQGG